MKRKVTGGLTRILAITAVVLATGCAGEAAPAPAPDTGTGEEARTVRAEGVLAPPEQGGNALTYNAGSAPPGATMAVEATGDDGGTEIRLQVAGLQPNRGYAAHAHVNPCGPTGDAAGPHFQDRQDPAAGPGKPSTDPAYANPRNEVWLDLRTDAAGSGTAVTEVPFAFGERAPASVVIHEAEVTAVEAGKAGSAGARLACLTASFT